MIDGDLESTRLKRPVSLAQQDFERRVALFTMVLAKEEGLSLLGGLASKTGREEAKQLVRLDSASRQARVAVAFGARADAPDRLQRLFEGVGAPLQQQLQQQLPVYLRRSPALVDEGAASGESCPAREAVSRRLVWEAIR